MVKTTVYLPEELKAGLARLSASEGVSEAVLIREAIRKAIAERTPPKPRIPLCAEGLGDPTVAERVEESLAGFGS
ncbi:MAG: type II toxin-antitoxin system antitoxin VapB26 [Acidobacteriota bacterium]